MPHFSYHLADEYELERLEPVLAVIAATTQPFSVHTTGLGVFTGSSPVIYLPLVKDAALADFHQRVWDAAQPAASRPTTHYAPDVWVPHITLAYGDVTPPRLGCAMEKVAFQPFNWEIQVDHLAVVYQLSGQVGRLQSRYEFEG